MAGEGATIATAWVQLAFSAEGVKQQIQKELDREADGKELGNRTGQGFLGGLGGALAGVGKVVATSLAAIGVVAAGAAVKGITAFSDFQGQMNEVFSLIPDAGQQTFDSLTKNVKDFSKQFGVLPEKVVPALYESLSSGVPTDNVFAFLEVAQKAARGGVTELATTVDGLTSVINAYGAKNIDAARASDIMFTAVKLGKTTFQELSSSLFNVNPAAAAVGIKFEEVSAALAQMTAQGVPTSVATTQIRSAIVELTQGAGKASKAFTEVSGKSFPDFIKEGGTLKGALDLMREAADKNGESLLDMFGSVEGGQAGLALTGANAEGFSKALDAMNASTGATDQAFSQLSKGLGPIFDKIKAGAQVFLIDIGEKLAPAVEAGIGKAQEIFTSLKNVAIPILDKVSDAIKIVIGSFTGAGADVEGSKGFVNTFIDIGAAARGIFDAIARIDFKSIFATALDFIRPVAEALGNLASSIIGLAIVGFNELKTLFENNRGTLSALAEKLFQVGNFLKSIFTVAVNALAGTFNFLARNMEAVKLVMVPLIAGFLAFKAIQASLAIYHATVTAITAVTKIWSVVQGALNLVMSANPIGILIVAITALVAGVIYAYTHFEGFRNVIDSVGDAIQWVYNWVKDNWQTILALLAGPVGVAVLLIAKNWDKIKEGVSFMVDKVKDLINSFIDIFVRLPLRIVDAIGNFTILLLSKGSDLIRGLVNGVVGGYIWIAQELGSLGSKVLGWIGDAAQWLYNKGINVIQGLINGISSYYSSLANILFSLPGDIIRWIGDLGDTLWNAGVQLIQGLIGGIGSMFGGVRDKLGELTGFLTSWKGPEERDKKLLIPAGQFIIEGLITGLESYYPRVKASLIGLSGSIGASTFASPAIGTLGATTGAPLSAGAAGGILGGPPLILNQTNNTNADPGEIAAATAFRLVTSGVY